MKILRNKYNTARSLITVNIVAWTAGAVLLFNSCPPMEELLQTRTIEAPQPAQPPQASATSSCSKGQCVFHLKDDSPVPREVRMFWLAQLGMRFSNAREKLLALEARGAPPLLTCEDQEVAGLIRTMLRVNENARLNYGYEPIPVSGPDAREQFRSVNAWLGREPDAPIDDRALGALDLKIVEAVME